jgi:hypothetical protein
MTVLLILLIISIFTMDYLATKLDVISKIFTLVPEFFSLLIALIVVVRYLVLRRWAQSVQYIWLFIAFFLVCMIGVVAEAVDPGPLIAGLRNHFKFLPLFFLPAVYTFSDKQLKILLGVFLLLVALQVPLAFFQRFVQFSDAMITGDPITGTVSTSSSLSIVLCLAIAVIMTFYAYGKLALSLALVLFCYFAAPTAINETKATMLFLPLAVLGPFLLARGVAGRWRKAFPVFAICLLGLAAFSATYNILIQARWGGTTIGEFISGAYYEEYLYRGVEPGGDTKNIGRLDSMILPVSIASDNFMQLIFGLGIGNVSPSSLPGTEGAYFEMAQEYGFGRTAIGNLLWETGIAGLALYLLWFVFWWRDSRRWAVFDHDLGWFGTWWSNCIILLLLALTYKSILNFNELGYLLFFWSGIVASRYWQLRHPLNGTVTSTNQDMPRLQLAGRKPEELRGLILD